MTTAASFADLRSRVRSDPKATAIVDGVEAKGGSPGDAALALINQRRAPGQQNPETWAAEYRESAALRAEFATEAHYISFRRYEQRKQKR